MHKPVSENVSLTPHQLVAHRGFQQRFPENTGLAVSEAIKAGALFVEVDIQLSQDLHPVVYHDISLERVSGCEGSITTLTLEQLKQLPAYEPERLGDRFIENSVSSLQEVVEILQQHPAVTLFVELKEQSIEHFGGATVLSKVCEVLESIKQRAVLISFDYETMQRARDVGWPQVGMVLRDWIDIDSPQFSALAGEYTFVNHSIIPSECDLSRLTTKLVVYEVGTLALAETLVKREVAMLETFDILGLLGE